MSLALTLPDNLPGALYKALSTFAWRGIDLTKIESRPLKTALGEYFFIIDVDYADKELVHFAQKELETIGINYKVLGAYPIYTIQDKREEKEWLEKILWHTMRNYVTTIYKKISTI